MAMIEQSSAPPGKAPLPQPGEPVRTRSRGWLLGILSLFGLIALGAAAWATLDSGLESGSAATSLTHTIERGRMLVTVMEDGNVESASNVDVKCDVAGGGTILWIIPDGQQVEEGETLVRLDTSGIDEPLNAQKIVAEKALATKIQAAEEFAAAKIAVEEYAEGTFEKEFQDAQKEVTIALENLSTARGVLDHTRKMYRKGFVTQLQVEADQFAVQRAELDLKSAETARDVMVKFTRPKMIKELEAARDAAEARMRSENAAYDLERAKLKKLEKQLDNCIIVAPQSGMVIYANERNRRGGNEAQIEEGSTVRERQTIIRLPDLDRMQVKCDVHESKIDQVQPGLRARVTVQGVEFAGTVESVANQPEPSGWFSANVKEYATVVSIDGETRNLKPGMSAEVEILIADLENVLSIPVAAVVELRGKFYCWVQSPEGPQQRPLVLGMTNDLVVEVKDGVVEGEQVLLNPRAIVPEARSGDLPQTDGEKSKFRGAKEKDRPEADPQPERTTPPASRPLDSDPTPSPGQRTEDKPAGQRPQFNLSSLDKDGDGRISRDEAPGRMQEYFDQIDTGGDGFIDAAEFAALKKRMQQMRAGGGK